VSRHLDRLLAALLALAGGYVLVTTTIGVVRHFSPVPWMDQWDSYIGSYVSALEDWPGSLWALHMEHRLVLSRLVFFADIAWAGGRNVLSLAASLVLALALAAALAWTVVRVKGFGPAGLGASGFVLALGFSWVQHENFAWAFQNQWFAVQLFALLSFAAFEQSRGRAGWTGAAWLSASLACGLIAAGSMASGLLVLPILVLLSLRPGSSSARRLAVAAVGAAMWGLYFWHYRSPYGIDPTSAMQHAEPLELLQFIALYLGTPAYHLTLSRGFALAAGIAAILAGAVMLVWALPRLAGERAKAVPLIAAMAFIGGCAIVTTIGRYRYGLDVALSSRYATGALAYWMATVCFLAANVSGKAAERAVLAAQLALAVPFLFAQDAALTRPAEELFQRKLAGLAMREQVYDDTYAERLYPKAALLINTVRRAEPRGISIFAPDSPDYPTHPAHVRASRSCRGIIDGITQTATPGVYLAFGWVYDDAEQRVPASLAITDADGLTVGAGVSGHRRDDVRTALAITAKYAGWFGFFRAPGGAIRAFGRDSSGSYCAIDAAKPVPEPPAAATRG
jgi:hypothetical protein